MRALDPTSPPADAPGTPARWRPFAPGPGVSVTWRAPAGGAALVRLPPPVPPVRAAAPGRDVSEPPPAASRPDGGYSVQVGAFRQRANARARAARLSAAGYAPRIVHARATKTRLFMVRLGAFDARPAAQAYARQVTRALDVDTWPVAN